MLRVRFWLPVRAAQQQRWFFRRANWEDELKVWFEWQASFAATTFVFGMWHNGWGPSNLRQKSLSLCQIFKLPSLPWRWIGTEHQMNQSLSDGFFISSYKTLNLSHTNFLNSTVYISSFVTLILWYFDIQANEQYQELWWPVYTRTLDSKLESRAYQKLMLSP